MGYNRDTIGYCNYLISEVSVLSWGYPPHHPVVMDDQPASHDFVSKVMVTTGDSPFSETAIWRHLETIFET